MMGRKKPGAALCILILTAAVAIGILVQMNERQYRSFFVEKASYGEADNTQAVSEQNTAADGKININTAEAKELESLEGIGEGLAQRIINYRTKNGSFEVIEDIMRVSGIGKKKFEAIKDEICVE